MASLASLILSAFIPLSAYLRLTDETGDLGGPLNLLLIPCINLLVGLVVSVITCQLLKYLRKNKLRNFFLVSFFLFGLVFAGMISFSRFTFSPSNTNFQMVQFLALGGCGLIISGPTYWFFHEMFGPEN